jgi:hypothetical protein
VPRVQHCGSGFSFGWPILRGFGLLFRCHTAPCRSAPAQTQPARECLPSPSSLRERWPVPIPRPQYEFRETKRVPNIAWTIFWTA